MVDTVKKQVKQRNRLGFQQRTSGLAPKPANLSPILDMQVGNMSVMQRFIKYNRGHKCKHGKWYDEYKVKSRSRTVKVTEKDGREVIRYQVGTPSWIEMICHCENEVFTKQESNYTCVCGHTLYLGKEVNLHCTFCRRKFYKSDKEDSFTMFSPPHLEKNLTVKSLTWDEVKEGKSTALSTYFKTRLYISPTEVFPSVCPEEEELAITKLKKKILINGQATNIKTLS